MRRIVARGAHVGIPAVGLEAQALPQEERSCVQAPVPRRLIAAPCLESVAGALHLVAQNGSGWGDGFDAAQLVVDIVEHGNRIRGLRQRLVPIAELEDLDHLGREVRTARELRGTGSHEKIAVDARGRAQGTRYRAPDQALRLRFPGKPRRRKGLGSGVVVVLELSPERELQVIYQRDLVLRKHVCPAHPLIGGQERQYGAVGHVIVPVPIAATPGKPVSSDSLQSVLELKIENVELLRENTWNVALGLVDIGLHLQTSPRGKVAVPTAEQICAGNMRVLVAHLVERAPVAVALQREAVPRSAPVGPKSALRLAPRVALGGAARGARVEDIEDPAVSPIRHVALGAAVARAGAPLQ